MDESKVEDWMAIVAEAALRQSRMPEMIKALFEPTLLYISHSYFTSSIPISTGRALTRLVICDLKEVESPL
jgi:hypothetical protein